MELELGLWAWGDVLGALTCGAVRLITLILVDGGLNYFWGY